MSGIDEGVPNCSKCVEIKGITESPTHWAASGEKSDIWVISKRFQESNPDYKDCQVIFSRSCDEFNASIFSKIQSFTCGWSVSDRERLVNNGIFWNAERHVFYKGSDTFERIMRFLEYSFERDGGCYV